MSDDSIPQVTVFEHGRRIASGPLPDISDQFRDHVRGGSPLLVFNEAGQRVDIDPRDPAQDAPQSRGRPKLGVVPREVTLLPRHWEWLAMQPGGASVSLRKLVEAAMRSPASHARQSQEAAYRFMTAIGGDLPGYEEATRALFAGDRARFEAQTDEWPADIRDHARILAGQAFG